MDVVAGELLSNIHAHAYYSGVGPAFVEVFQVRWTVTILVIDMGDAVTTPAVPRSLPVYRRRGGRGLYLARCLSDELVFALNRDGHGLSVRATRWFDDAFPQAKRRHHERIFPHQLVREDTSPVPSIWA
jgi:anti-sigma regulatory factor (Ser/Thr protein kinase)